MNSKYYVFTPAFVCSGGPEALHQLAYYMRRNGLEAYTVYYEYSGFVDAKPTERYVQYDPITAKYEDVEDEPGNFVIAPENAPWCLNGFHKAQKCIWWLGLIAAKMEKGKGKERLLYYKHKLLGQSIMSYRKVGFELSKCWHFCGSKYAYLEVRNKFPQSKVEYLVEPISLDFLRMGNFDLPLERENIVLYNPAKPSKCMAELVNRGLFNYVPLKGFTPEGLAAMYKKAKLYVDFGDFGGPERMPKEAAYFGCNILVANHNAAANDFDVAIPEKYKVAEDETIEQIEGRLADMVENYEKQNVDFLPFKNKVEGLEQRFVMQLKEVF